MRLDLIWVKMVDALLGLGSMAAQSCCARDSVTRNKQTSAFHALKLGFAASVAMMRPNDVLVARLFPNTPSSILQLLGLLSLALSARVSVSLPGLAVPITLQSLAVVIVGALFGQKSVWMVTAYLAAGFAGLPVFAPTGRDSEGWRESKGTGYLLGFPIAAALVARTVAENNGVRPPATKVFRSMLLAHSAILFCGWMWLRKWLDARKAWRSGVAPFLVGAVVKSLVGMGFHKAVLDFEV